ncbi:MAG: bile acid:sodium symporter family protein [Leptolyngbyaceae cyanobacterium]
MEASFLTTVFLPMALFIIMLGMGLGLTIDDFKRIFAEPKAIVVGLLAQLVMLPVIGFLLATSFPLTPELAVGIVVLAVCPGGPTSNLVSYLVQGNVALSITLPAISSLVTVLTIPLLVNGAMRYFMGEAIALQLPFLKTVLQIAVISLIPVALGMVLHHYITHLAAQVERQVKWLSLVFLALIVVGLLAKERANVVSFFLQVGGVTLALNVLTMGLGFAIARLSQLTLNSAKAITVEVGIQNGTLAIAIASSPVFLDMPSMAIPAAIYSLIMFASSAVFAGLVQRQRARLKN